MLRFLRFSTHSPSRMAALPIASLLEFTKSCALPLFFVFLALSRAEEFAFFMFSRLFSASAFSAKSAFLASSSLLSGLLFGFSETAGFCSFSSSLCVIWRSRRLLSVIGVFLLPTLLFVTVSGFFGTEGFCFSLCPKS